jgi:PAS domain S-box-containing protein
MAGLLHAVFGRFEFSVIFAAAPIIAVMLATVHIYLRHTEDQARIRAERVAAAERAADESARHLDELRESEGRFQSAFTHAAVGMVLVATDGRIVEANASLAHMLGRTEPELAGADIGQLFHPEDQAALRDEMHRILGGGETTFATELRCVHSQGFDVWVLLNGSISPEGVALPRPAAGTSPHGGGRARLQHRDHDDLTDLANRNYFTEQLARAIATVRRHRDRRFGVLSTSTGSSWSDSLWHSAGTPC